MKIINFKFVVNFIIVLFCIFQNVFATTKNKFISYTDVGKGHPIVLIHAFPTDERLWDPQREELKKYFRVITLDLWGFGKSTSVDGKAVTMTDYADEVKQLLDELHIEKAIVGGESMGGYIALAFYEKYANSVDGLILSDTQSIADSEEAKKKREATAIDVLEHGTTQAINNFMPKALTAQASEQTKRFLQNILEAQAPTAVASALRGMALRSDTSFLLAKSSLPILIITGENDVLISPQQSENMHQLARSSKLVVLSNAAHLSNLEQPEAWNKAVVGMFY